MLNCLNVTNSSSLKSSQFEVTNDCAVFDFIIYTVMMGLLCMFGLAGNALSFTVLWRDTSKTGATAFILRALAVADSLVLLSAMPLYVAPFVAPAIGYLQSYYEIYPNIMPYLWPIYLIPYTATILLTVLVSLNRYFAVCRPLASTNKCGMPQVKKHVLAIACFAILYNIPRFFEYEKKEMCDGYNKTKEVFDMSDFGINKIYRIIYANALYFFIMHGGPLICLMFLNVRLIVALKQRQRKRCEMGVGDYQQDITLVLVVVVFAFISCQTPTFIDHILWTFVNESARQCGRWHYYYTAIGDMMAILNSSINFLIYVLTSRRFRQGLMQLVCKQSTSRFMFENSKVTHRTTILGGEPTEPLMNHNGVSLQPMSHTTLPKLANKSQQTS